MKQQVAIGIDLGTSTSEIAVYRNEPVVLPDPTWKTPIVPSLVAVDSKGRLQVGETARSNVDIPGRGAREIKRKMGTGETVQLMNNSYRPEEISAMILRKLKENAEEALNTAVTEVVLSVPANFADAARNATMTAAELAGLKVLRAINEPTAAALAFGIKHINAEEQLVVFDFGGGTLDISVCEMLDGILDVKCSYGDPRLGGKDIDEAIARYLLEQFQRQYPRAKSSERQINELKSYSEKTKRALSTQTTYSDVLLNFAQQNGEPIDLELELSRAEMERIIAPILERARDCIRLALNAKKLRPSSIDRVLLVGGTTYIPAVRKLVAEMFNKDPKADVEPDLAVAMGACITAAQATGVISEEDGIILTDVCPFSLGVDPISLVGGQLVVIYEPLIERNQHVPFSCKKEYHLLHTQQEIVEIHLYQDNLGTAKIPADATDTGLVARIEGIPPASDGQPHPVEVDFSYDINGLVTLKARIPAINREVTLKHMPNVARMDSEQKQQAITRLQDLWRRSARASQYEGIIGKAERLMDETSVEKNVNLLGLLTELKEALANDDTAAIKTCGDQLVDMMFEIENEHYM